MQIWQYKNYILHTNRKLSHHRKAFCKMKSFCCISLHDPVVFFSDIWCNDIIESNDNKRVVICDGIPGDKTTSQRQYIVLFLRTIILQLKTATIRWRHNGHDGLKNHQPHDRLLNRLFRRRSKKTSKLRVTGLCAGNSPGTGEFLAQMTSNGENFSIWWRHHKTADMSVWMGYAQKQNWCCLNAF